MDGRIERAKVFISQAQGRAREVLELLASGQGGKLNLPEISGTARSLVANLASAEIELAKPEDSETATPGR